MRGQPSWCGGGVLVVVLLMGCQASSASDADGDGSPDTQDCAPADPEAYPGQTERCDGTDDDCDGVEDEGFDVDGDGFTLCGGDCDDGSADIHPSVTEVCDGTDNDCDQVTDEGYDADEDGVTSCAGDCDELLPNVNPGASEVCDLLDNDCDGMADEGFDADGDLMLACDGDCDDTDVTVGMGMPEIQDGKDNDCSGLADEPFVDADGDGFTPFEGDCDDIRAAVGPRALEFQGNAVDDDCDGVLDEALLPCDGGSIDAANPLDFARAIGLCNGEVVSAEYVGFGGNGAAGRAIATQFGTHTATLNRPAEGVRMGILSSGRADASSHDSGYAFDGMAGPGCTAATHPFPGADPGACGATDPATVCDLAEIRLTIRVPANAPAFSYQFQYWSAEYPTFRCTIFDDTFLALLTSGALGPEQNISLDNNQKVVSVNTGFFDVCLDDLAGMPRDINGNGIINPGEVVPTTNDCSIENGAALASTGYVFDNDATNNGAPDAAGSLSLGAGATTMLTTFAPVLPGETITLRFIIFDEGDDQLDSTTVIDNFLWQLDAVSGPITQQ